MSGKSIFRYLTFGQAGSVMVSQCRNALRRNSRSHSGSPFLCEMSRIVSSDSPLGATSASISVTKPCWYGCSIRFWRAELVICKPLVPGRVRRRARSLDAEALAAAALARCVRVLELERPAEADLLEVQRRAVQISDVLLVDYDLRVVRLEGEVVRAHLVREVERVGEPGAAHFLDAHPQAHALAALGDRLADVLGGGLSQCDRHAYTRYESAGGVTPRPAPIAAASPCADRVARRPASRLRAGGPPAPQG